jgi:hypothetical protein
MSQENSYLAYDFEAAIEVRRNSSNYHILFKTSAVSSRKPEFLAQIEYVFP